jgi:GT2 family glycosyltransferase
MRFDKNWDTILINSLLPNSILSAYPPAYPLYGKFEENKTHHTNDWNREKIGGFPFVMKPNDNGEDYCKSTIAAGFHFTTIDWLEKVGYDKLLCWKYEEIDLTYRSIGMGYLVINYKHTPLYHLYDRSKRKQYDNAEVFLSDCNERMKLKLNDEYTKKVNDYYNINFFDFL